MGFTYYNEEKLRKCYMGSYTFVAFKFVRKLIQQAKN
jgi:hypothetical protein